MIQLDISNEKANPTQPREESPEKLDGNIDEFKEGESPARVDRLSRSE